MQTQKIPWYSRLWQFVRAEFRWLTPGMGVKRWLALILLGTTLIGLGFAVILLDVYRSAPEGWWIPFLRALSMRDLPRWARAILFGGTGLMFIFVGLWGFNRSLLRPFVRPGARLVDTLSAYRKRGRGPRIVVIGGGHGLASLLRGMKAHSHNLTAIVTVADDGGSSGELRRDMGVLPPGDIRNCLAAMADDETLMTQLFQYRFPSGNGLSGHSVGNLLITALADITGSFEEAVAESGRVLAVQGRVLPSTLHDVRLAADITVPYQNRVVRVRGESRIPQAAGKVRRLYLEPANTPAYPPAVQAILSADLILIGPGSLYTSVLPNLLVHDLSDAIRASRAVKFYVCNVATQPGETDGYGCLEHVKTLESHVGAGLFDLVLCNGRYDGRLPAGVDWVRCEPELQDEYVVYCTDLVNDAAPHRHDSSKLAQVVMDLFFERTGPSTSREDSL